MNWLNRAMDIINKGVSIFLILILGLMTTVLFLSVISRYFFGASIPWSDPLARYGQTWIMLLGSALALRKGLHIGVDNLINRLPEKKRQVVLKINVGVIFIFSVTMTVQGMRLIKIAGTQIIPEMGIPMAHIYIMIPVAGVLMSLSCLELLFSSKITGLTAKE